MAISNTVNIYGKTPPTSTVNVIKGASDKLIGFSYPFGAVKGKGYFSSFSGGELIASNIKALLRTHRGERFMLPVYGCNLKEFLMDTIDDITIEEIKRTISNSISLYLGDIKLENLSVMPLNEDSSLRVTLYVSVKADPQVKIKLSLNI